MCPGIHLQMRPGWLRIRRPLHDVWKRRENFWRLGRRLWLYQRLARMIDFWRRRDNGLPRMECVGALCRQATCQRAERVSVRQGTRPRIHVSRKNLPVGHPAGGAGPRSRTSRLSQKACWGDSHSTPNRTEPREGPRLAFRLGGITAHYILLGESLPGQRKVVCSNNLVPCWRICEYCPSL